MSRQSVYRYGSREELAAGITDGNRAFWVLLRSLEGCRGDGVFVVNLMGSGYLGTRGKAHAGSEIF